MPEHYTKNVQQATFWCSTCHADTLHRVDKGRRGPCLSCLENLGRKAPKSGSLPCPNASKKKTIMGAKTVISYRCASHCTLCHGTGYVEDCRDCAGAGLRVGGVRCDTCQCTGKVPAATVAA